MSKNKIKISEINIVYIIITIMVCVSCSHNQDKAASKIVFQKMRDGSKKVIGATINNKKEGLWIEYDDSGRLATHYTYIHDSLLGEAINYGEEGKIVSTGILKNDQREGAWVEYYNYDKNKIAEKGSYNKGDKIGVWEYYIEDGRLNRKIDYSNKEQKVILNNHLLPLPPDKMKSSPIDSNNRAFVTDSNGKEVTY